MAVCDKCGKEVALPYTCSYCGKVYCSEHRLPENHDCKAPLDKPAEKQAGVISGPVQEPKPEGQPKPFEIRFDFDTARPAQRPKRRRLLPLASFAILGLMAAVFIAQLVAELVLGSGYYTPGDHGSLIYYLAASRATLLERPWTLVTSLFAHGGFLHIMFNGLVLLSFGPILELRIGTKKFLVLFFAAGVLAGLAQLAFMPSEVVLLGASGAILGVLGALTALVPRMPVLVFFFIPLKLWIATLGFGVLSVLLAVFDAGGSIANVAHFAGLVIGLLYGLRLRRDDRRRQADMMKRMFGPFLPPAA